MSSIEIERKFLVVGQSYKRLARASRRLCQGYICRGHGRTVRVRIADGRGYLTIKGPSLDGGLSRYEFEHEISPDEARQLMLLCEPGQIDKTRWLVDVGRHTFEVDEFHGQNEGLVVAEVELSAPDEPFERPDFLGREVTGDRHFYNSYLTERPFAEWTAVERALVKSLSGGADEA